MKPQREFESEKTKGFLCPKNPRRIFAVEPVSPIIVDVITNKGRVYVNISSKVKQEQEVKGKIS